MSRFFGRLELFKLNIILFSTLPKLLQYLLKTLVVFFDLATNSKNPSKMAPKNVSMMTEVGAPIQFWIERLLIDRPSYTKQLNSLATFYYRFNNWTVYIARKMDLAFKTN